MKRAPQKMIAACVVSLYLLGCTEGADSGLAAFIASETNPNPAELTKECFAKENLPAVIETVTERKVKRPEVLGKDGVVIRKATYRTQSRQNIVSERREIEYQTLCASDYTPELISNLQRALKARGYYSGAVNGLLTPTTEKAVKDYQVSLNFPATKLARFTAQQLGLIAYSRTDISANQL